MRWLVQPSIMDLPSRLAEQLAGKEGKTRQKAARLVVDLAEIANAEGFIEVDNAHVSGVSVITGGHGFDDFCLIYPMMRMAK